MATCRKRKDSWEFKIQAKAILGKPRYLTFPTKEEGDRVCAYLEAQLRQGIMPPELADMIVTDYVTFGDVIRDYISKVVIKDDDVSLLGVVLERHGKTRLSLFTYDWVETWISELKTQYNLAPSTVRKYVGALARCFDWGSNKCIPALTINHLRRLPRGYSSYSKLDVDNMDDGFEVKEDEERDRRLEDGEEERIRAAMGGYKRADKERPLLLRRQAAIECMFELGLELAMRMRETYTLTWGQVDFARRTIFLDKTKNGSKRQVPMTSVAVKALETYKEHVANQDRGMAGFEYVDGRIFPWWNGDSSRQVLRHTSNVLSQIYKRIFAYAECDDFNYHDLRHEATSRFFERTTLSDGQIMKITGHKSPRMLLRYANLRASNLAEKLW